MQALLTYYWLIVTAAFVVTYSAIETRNAVRHFREVQHRAVYEIV